MKDHHVFWKLEGLSDRQLLERLGSTLCSSRRLMAQLVAHLGEVEERRLHLAAACSSMFAYCLKLGMTEDEAYRRIEVARLARRYPAIFPLLAAGQLTISVLALLKHHLSNDNHLELLAAVTGKSVVQTRELIAARFPRPDVPTSVRKLPEQRITTQPPLALSMSAEPRVDGTEPRTSVTQWSPSERVAPLRVSSRIEPLSERRYKVQFTASAELARKLELARDLMRHCHPRGELGPVIERALDLLIGSVMQRRFGKKTSPKRPRERANLEQRGDIIGDRFAMQHTAEPGTAEPAPAIDTPTIHTPSTDTPETPPTEAHATAMRHGYRRARPPDNARYSPDRA